MTSELEDTGNWKRTH